jgi:hypothetical protein
VSRYHRQVDAALAAVTIRGETRYAWMGSARRPLPAALLAELDAAQRRDHLVACLREELYSGFYCHGRPVPGRWIKADSVSADPWMAHAISQANTGRGSWEPGWMVERIEGEQTVVATPELRVRVAVADCRTRDGPVRVGATVDVRLPKELPALSPGFHMVIGEAMPAAPASSAGVVRVYWNVARTGAAALVGELTSRLNAGAVPFRLKVANHPLRLARCDAAVLYLAADDFPALRETLLEVAGSLTEHLRPRIPAFTLELVPGVGLAESDGTGESFGDRRCTLLADAIVRAHEQGVPGIDAVSARFAEAGVRMDAPYLEPSLCGRHVL